VSYIAAILDLDLYADDDNDEDNDVMSERPASHADDERGLPAAVAGHQPSATAAHVPSV